MANRVAYPEQKVIADMAESNIIVSNILYRQKDMYKSIMTDIKNNPNAIPSVVAQIALHVLDKTMLEFERKFKRKMLAGIIFGTGLNILDKITTDIKYSGGKEITQEEHNLITKLVVTRFMDEHQNDMDMQDIGIQLKELFEAMQNGSLVNKLSDVSGVPREPVKKTIAQAVNKAMPQNAPNFAVGGVG